ncbi:unnamed protein product [Caenorhabditis auriculariae]|uniref:Uncharacterized protein n=1 Tax=Caenorhabditis auriculariae TaxID=2777116 RepID=A0A8S1HET7_9PELO|nr:unnamed protein product [Caenorhabditis auriculariae]
MSFERKNALKRKSAPQESSCWFFSLTLFLINKYSNPKKQNFIVTISTFLGWFFSFIIIFVLPRDVSITFYEKCEIERERTFNASGTVLVCELPGGYVKDNVLLNLWRVVYWTAQLLTWIVLPLLQSYATAGDFTKIGKIKAAVYNNALYYGVYAVFFVSLVIYALLKGVAINAEHMKVILVSASNTWGLFLLVVLLGYGLVELPRSLWYTGRRTFRLNKVYFDIEKLSSDKSEAEENFKDVYRKARAVLNSLKSEHEHLEKAQKILSTFPDNVVFELFPARNATEFISSNVEVKVVGSESYLIRLHKKAIQATQAHQRTIAQWRNLIDHALFLENVLKAETTGTSLHLNSNCLIPTSLRRLWFVVLQRPVSKVCGVLLAGMTFFILLSECTFFLVSPTLSPAALLTDYAAQRFHYKYTQIVAMAIIFYLCACAYFTIFRLKIYRYYHLDPHRNTDANSLLFSAILLCRLTPPICLNFLGMIHLDSHISLAKDFGVETQFTKLMGHLDVLPILAKGINIYLPICILFFCAINYYRLSTYVLHSLGFDQFVEEDDLTKDMINAGRSLVQIERNALQRKTERSLRNESWAKNSTGKKGGSRNKNLAEDERPMINGGDEGDDEWSGEWTTSSLQPGIASSEASHPVGPTQKSQEHPSSVNFFDDM